MSQVSPSLRATYLPSSAPGQCPRLTLKLKNKLRDSFWSPPFSLTQKTPLAPHRNLAIGMPRVPAAYPTPSEDPTGLLLKSGTPMGVGDTGKHPSHVANCSGFRYLGWGLRTRRKRSLRALSVGRATSLGQRWPANTHLHPSEMGSVVHQDPFGP